MGDHLPYYYDDYGEEIVVCSACGKRYRSKYYDQTPGCRSEESDYCPYCNHENRTSLEYEFHSYKID